MTEIAIELDDETAKRLGEASEKDGLTPSAWIQRAIHTQLDEKLPESFFAVLGTWEDHRSTEEIFRDIREEAPQTKRMALK
jgi:predicted transcriptional regulator